jgi:geranylgeranyl reductase family protein
MLAGGAARSLNTAVQDARYDAVVIGGGPAGSSAGSYLAMAGKKVLILEKAVFPRFHIGESLLPYNQILLRELGVVEALEKCAFPRKHGAQFHLGNGSKSVKILFRESRFNKEHQTFQVERAKFDEILLRNAEKKGAAVLEGMTVKRAENDASGVRVVASDREGATQTFEAEYLIDASGRGNFTGNRDGLREIDPDLKKLAVFAHFSGVQADEGERGGDIVIVREKDGWFWLIPVGSGKTSVGGVLDANAYREMGLKPDEALQSLIESCPEMRGRMARAEKLMPVQATTDYSYRNRELTGPRLLRVGDAAGFVDPIFSGGVYLAMSSGKRAATAIIDVLNGRRSERRALAKYEKTVLRAISFYHELVQHYYTTPFMEVLLEPRRGFFSVVDAVVAALAGQFSDSWFLRWRMRLFYRLVKLQGKRPFLPRISFD